MKILKRAAICAAAFVMTTATALAKPLPDHTGTSLESFEFGTNKLVKAVTQYNDLFKTAGNTYGVDPNILAAICMQESAGVNYSYRPDGTEYPAWGIMQIEYTHEKAFAAFGKKLTGEEWTLEDRLDPEKAVTYAAYLLSESLYRYDGDYIKMLQAYNFGDTVLMRILNAVNDEWLSERINAVKYIEDWPYETYGDANYVEHVLQYYYENIEYVGAKVRMDGELIKFNDQYPIIEDGTTLIPVRAVSEALGAKVTWDGDKREVTIKGGGKTIRIVIDSVDATINNKPVSLPGKPATIRNGRTLVPLRFVGEALDIDVDWEQETRTVLLCK